jgi:hypothetical protein
MGRSRVRLIEAERTVKYIAKSAAKNINSLESQTIVPTATRFGRLWGSVSRSWLRDALVTAEIMAYLVPKFVIRPFGTRNHRLGPKCVASIRSVGATIWNRADRHRSDPADPRLQR